MEKECDYKRVGTTYYKTINRPNLFGDKVKTLVTWNFDTIKQDHGRDYLSEVPKYDGFCFLPDHLNYKSEDSGFLNKYQPLPYKPEQGCCNKILDFLNHIFGEQIDIGLDYLTILYRYPTQRLPILCLVSQKRNTGKTTFLMFLKNIFGDNMTINTNEDFRSQFNSHWALKLLIGVDEVLLDKKEDSERIKNLSTAKSYKTEAKGKDRVEVDFIGKFVLCSNNEDNFIIIDPLETRYWIRKIECFEKENNNLLEELKEQTPQFLEYLKNRKLTTQSKTRMWFTAEQINTDALKKIKNRFRNKTELELLEIFKEIIEANEEERLSFTNDKVRSLLERSGIKINRSGVREILEKNWGLQQQSNSYSYKEYYYDDTGLLMNRNVTGRYYTLKIADIERIYDELMR